MIFRNFFIVVFPFEVLFSIKKVPISERWKEGQLKICYSFFEQVFDFDGFVTLFGHFFVNIWFLTVFYAIIWLILAAVSLFLFWW